jgi:2-C-methyl-D-erythritol 4-phosphate cytidylyltransferase
VSDINTAVILSAGKGSRMKAEINKQFLLLQNKPVIVHALEAFEQCSEIDEIIVVAASDELQYFRTNIIDKFNFNKVRGVIAGGLERQQSAYNGLKSISQDCEIVLIHDGARPFVSQQTIIDCINGARIYGAVSAGMPSKDTIKLVDENDMVTLTPPRDRVWQTQTPQAFKRTLIIEAHEIAQNKGITATDDTMLVEMLGYQVKMLAGSYENIKITTPDDLSLGEQLIKTINR